MSHIPVRNCAACRIKLPKGELTRIVRSPDGRVFYDETGKADGRGMYWCGSRKCLDKIRKKGLVGRMLKTGTRVEIFDRLEEVIKGY